MKMKKEYLKKYDMVLRTITPVFVGDGDSIKKKEYIYLPWENSIIVPDPYKMFQEFRRRNLLPEYEKFLMNPSQGNLAMWLKEHRFQQKDYEKWMKYKLNAGDIELEKKSNLEIRTCVKDAFGMPYIPGSTIKGMIRTALLCREIVDKKEKYRELALMVERERGKPGTNRNFLSKEARNVEVKAFHTLKREEKNISNATNSNMAGLLISDSESLPVEKLTLCQKVDVAKSGKSHSLNLLRECIKPETEIHFTITIDTSICPYTIEDIFDAIQLQNQINSVVFYKKFPTKAPLAKNTVAIGGGVGYQSKTVTYPLIGEKNGVDVVTNIFRNTIGKNYERHYHDKINRAQNLAPHVVKCTQYHGRLEHMGLCFLEYANKK